MDLVIVFLILLVIAIISIKKYKHFGILPFVPMVLCILFIGALSINVMDTVAYLDNHPSLNGNQVGWFPGYWTKPYLLALLIVVGTPIYLKMRSRRIPVKEHDA